MRVAYKASTQEGTLTHPTSWAGSGDKSPETPYAVGANNEEKGMDEEVIRKKEIKLRLSEAEHKLLQTLAPNDEPLAPILRTILCAAAKVPEGTLKRLFADAQGQGDLLDYLEKREKKTKAPPIPKADPVLLRALAGIGNNVNQIARYCNTAKASGTAVDLAAVAVELMAISEELKKLNHDS